VRSPASAGSNGLLVSGAAPARDTADVLALLGLSHASPGAPPVLAEPPGGDAGRVLEAVGWTPAGLDEVAGRCGAPLGPVAVHLAALQADGWVAQREGWYERVR
jgi:predicted Rossmann fold nucleotide-binding protein DprA/Smf involved in DNA uptake